jgi:uncharacterized membrane protein (UPF0127 family)
MAINPNRLKVAVFVGVIVIGYANVHIRHKEQAAQPQTACVLQFGEKTLFNVPQATTNAQRARGLSWQADVGPGMLFSWPSDEIVSFWMKDTPTPLSIAFLDAHGNVVQIENMDPLSETAHISKQPVREALEVKQGDFQRLGITVGSRLINKKCTPISSAEGG